MADHSPCAVRNAVLGSACDFCGLLSSTGLFRPGITHRPFVHLETRPQHFVKNYVLDTNVILHDPNSILSFQENNVLIPIEVIEEVDRFKREASELGQNAREFSRALDKLRTHG